MRKITFILLNWKRSDNLKQVIRSIRSQTIESYIYLWNNNIEDTYEYDVDYQINSSKHIICYGRWTMISYVETEFVATLDDDIMYASTDVLAKELRVFDDIPYKDLIIGPYGRNIKDDSYTKGSDITDVFADTDIVKGRHMIMRTELVRNLDMRNEPEEDIKVSSLSKHKMIIPNEYINLTEGDEALWRRTNHWQNRDIAVKKYFNNNG